MFMHAQQQNLCMHAQEKRCKNKREKKKRKKKNILYFPHTQKKKKEKQPITLYIGETAKET